jgi:hypothetical protein
MCGTSKKSFCTLFDYFSIDLVGCLSIKFDDDWVVIFFGDWSIKSGII